MPYECTWLREIKIVHVSIVLHTCFKFGKSVISTHLLILDIFLDYSTWNILVKVAFVLSPHGWKISMAPFFTAIGGLAAVRELPKAVIPYLADLASSLDL